jgi:hypothetical protein
VGQESSSRPTWPNLGQFTFSQSSSLKSFFQQSHFDSLLCNCPPRLNFLSFWRVLFSALISAYWLPRTCFLFGLFLYTEDGKYIFFRNFGWLTELGGVICQETEHCTTTAAKTRNTFSFVSALYKKKRCLLGPKWLRYFFFIYRL